ncbi:GTP 3',8-cyclase MoaA [Candidatus Bathyarchaeota archaeon]|nr:GTP 3',8-cyclase MoaA [Candidatus Bathyarchaeota archaeon]
MTSPQSSRLQDRFGRLVNSLRISLTQRCNFNCFFCHKEGESNPLGEMTVKEIEAIVEASSNLGIRKVKLTGGEPLIRDDVVEIVKSIAPYVEEVSMTTNGSLLKERAKKLKKAGLKRVNISLHSTRRDVFWKITGQDLAKEVMEGIKAAIDNRLIPVKLNMVAIRKINSEEIPEMIEFSKRIGAILQLIEFQPIQEGAKEYSRLHYDLHAVEEDLAKKSIKIYERDLNRRRRFLLERGGEVEVVRPMHNSEFCRYCSRLRVTSDGRLKPCLMRDDNLIEAVSLIRSGASKEDLENAIREAVSNREPYWRS